MNIIKKYLIFPAFIFVTVVGLSLAGTTKASTINVSIQDNQFSPQNTSVNIGDTVVWTNNGSNSHTVTSDTGVFSSGTLTSGQTFSYTFNNAGTFPYYCTFHGSVGGAGMSGVITVGTQNSTTTTSTSAPVISSVNSSIGPTGTNATITWITDQTATSQVEYGLTPSSLTSQTGTDSNLVTNHSVTLSNLVPGTTYYYEILSNNSSGVNTTSSTQVFTTVISANGNMNTNTYLNNTGNIQSLTPAQIQTLEDEIANLLQQISMIIQEIKQSGAR